jgi:hypothetical protein
MKVTWFGGSTLRIHIGGQIVVVDAATAPEGIDRQELTGGADMVTSLSGNATVVDGPTWKPRPARRLLDEDEAPRPVQAWALGEGSLLLDADGEPPLLVVSGDGPDTGRWAERAVVLVVGGNLAGRADAILTAVAPRLLALAGSDAELDAALAKVSGRLDGTGLMALERGMALEA